MIAIHENKLCSIIDKHEKQFDTHLKVVTKSLSDLRMNQSRPVKSGQKKMLLSSSQLRYVHFLENNITQIAKSNTYDLERFKRVFDRIMPASERTKGKGFIVFKDEILRILGYHILRAKYYPGFYSDLGLKACVYCNSQLTIVASNYKGKLSAKFQVDHFISKAEYPCFSISFFNLYPVCASCNHKKGKNPVNFELYSDNSSNVLKSEFKFTLDPNSITQFRLNGRPEELKVEFDDNGSKIERTFIVKGIYNTQKDIAAELIWKSMIYNESYKKNLRTSFEKLYGKDPINFKRIIIGNYSEERDIHKRPMAKFTQDIAKQLKLI